MERYGRELSPEERLEVIRKLPLEARTLRLEQIAAAEPESMYAVNLITHLKNPCGVPETCQDIRRFYVRMAKELSGRLKCPYAKRFLEEHLPDSHS